MSLVHETSGVSGAAVEAKFLRFGSFFKVKNLTPKRFLLLDDLSAQFAYVHVCYEFVKEISCGFVHFH